MSNYEVPETFQDFINLDETTKTVILRDQYDEVPIEWELRVALSFTFESPFRFAAENLRLKEANDYVLHVYETATARGSYPKRADIFARNLHLTQEQQTRIFKFASTRKCSNTVLGLAENPNLSPYVALAIIQYLTNGCWSSSYVAKVGYKIAKSEKIHESVVEALFELDSPVITSTLAQNPSVSDELINKWIRKLGGKHED